MTCSYLLTKNRIYTHPSHAETSITQLLHQLKHPAQKALADHVHLKSIEQTFPDYDSSYFTFSFVRKPRARLASWFNFLQSHGNMDSDFQGFLDELSTQNENDSMHLSANQADYLEAGEGKKEVQFLGRYEQYEEDLRKLFHRIDIPVVDIPRLNIANPYEFQGLHTAMSQ